MRRLTTLLAALLLAIGLAGALLVLFISLPIHERKRSPGIAMAMPAQGLGVMPEPLEPGRRYAKEAAAGQDGPHHRLDGRWSGPVPEGGLVLRRLEGPAGEFLVPVVPGADGSFAVQGLAEGRYELGWRDGSGVRHRHELALERDVTLPELGRSPATATSLRLLAPDGTPLAAGARVLLWSSDGRFVRASTDDEGRIGLDEVGPGDWAYEVRARVGDGAPRRYEGRVRIDAEAPDLRLGEPVNEG